MTLLLYNGYIAPGKYALETGPLVTSLGPIGIHELCDKDTVIGKNS